MLRDPARTPIGYVKATVSLPLYQGDKLDGPWDWFEYAEPGITSHWTIGVCRRECKTLSAKVVLAELKEDDHAD